MSMMPIQSTSLAFAQGDAPGVSHDAQDAGAQADDFSNLLAALFAPLQATSQPEQPLPSEAQSTDEDEQKVIPQDCSLPAPDLTQPFITIRNCIDTVAANQSRSENALSSIDASPNRYRFVTQNEFQVEAGAADSKIKLNDIFDGLQQIEEKSQVEQVEAAPSNSISSVSADTPTINKTRNDPALFSATLKANRLDSPERGDTESLFQQKIEVESPQPQMQQAGKFSLPNQVEPTLIPANFTRWQKDGFGNYSFSPTQDFSSQSARSISSQVAAAFHIVQNEGKVRAGTTSQPELSADSPAQPHLPSGSTNQPEPIAPDAPELLIIATSSSLKGKASAFMEKEIEPSAKTVESPSQEAGTSPQTAPILNATAPSPLAARDGSINTSQSVTAQIAHALTETIGEVSTRREARSIRLRLHPEELGEVQISVTVDSKGRMSAQITSEHDSTHRAITDGLDGLRDAFVRAGVDLERLDINLSQQSSAGPGTQTGTSSHQETTHAAATANATISPETSAGDDKLFTEEERLLNLRA